MQEIEADYMTPDGVLLRIRPLEPSDEKAWIDFVNGLSPDSSYHRFFQILGKVSHRDAIPYLNIDFNKRMAMIAVTSKGERNLIAGIARYELIPDTRMAEFAIVVADEFQEKGIGTFLLSSLSAFAKSKGIEGFVAEVLPDNERMMEVFRNSGLKMGSNLNYGTKLVKLFF